VEGERRWSEGGGGDAGEEESRRRQPAGEGLS
jgi:hypothetical protein